MGQVRNDYDVVAKISIVPRGPAGGVTIFMPSEDRLNSGTCRDFEQGVGVGVCVNHLFAKVSVFSFQVCRGLAAYSVMPANEASGIGGWSYGRIALYLQRGGQDPYPPTKSGAFPFPETRFSGSVERNSTCQTCQCCSCMLA